MRRNGATFAMGAVLFVIGFIVVLMGLSPKLPEFALTGLASGIGLIAIGCLTMALSWK